MTARLAASSSHAKFGQLIPWSVPNPNGKKTYLSLLSSIRVPPASNVQGYHEFFFLVGKVFGVPVPGKAIRNRLRIEWTNLQRDFYIDHIGRDWYKVVFYLKKMYNLRLRISPGLSRAKFLLCS